MICEKKSPYDRNKVGDGSICSFVPNNHLEVSFLKYITSENMLHVNNKKYVTEADQGHCMNKNIFRK